MRRLPIFVATGVLWACGVDDPGRAPVDHDPVAVTVSPSLDIGAPVSYAGTVTADQTVAIATRIAGSVERVEVDVGSVLREGDLLLRLDDLDVRARIAEAEAMAELTRRVFRRVEALSLDGAASDHELDRARADHAASEAGLSEARAQLRYTEIRAPFAGTITRRDADPGMLATPGVSLLTLVSTERPNVETYLPASLQRHVDVGDVVIVTSPSDGWERPGVVSRVVPALESDSRRFRVEVALDLGAHTPVPGTFVRVAIEGGASTWWIPEDALVHRGQLVGVYTVESDTLRLRWVRLGARAEGRAELLAGAGIGADSDVQVVRSPGVDLFDGRPVSRVTVEEWGVAR